MGLINQQTSLGGTERVWGYGQSIQTLRVILAGRGSSSAVQSAGRTGAAKVHPSLGEAGVKICPAEIVARPTPPKMILIMINLRIPFNAMFFRVFCVTWNANESHPSECHLCLVKMLPSPTIHRFPLVPYRRHPIWSWYPDFSATVGYKGSIRFSCVMHPLENDGWQKKSARSEYLAGLRTFPGIISGLCPLGRNFLWLQNLFCDLVIADLLLSYLCSRPNQNPKSFVWW